MTGNDLAPRHFLVDDDLSPQEQASVLDLAQHLADNPYAERPFAGPRSVAIMSDKPTLRTQLSFSAGIAELGGHPLMVDSRLAGIGTREPIADCARILGRQVSAIAWRTGPQARLTELAAYAGVPVVNALTDEFHPCQALAALLTLRQRRGALGGLRLGYVGDGANNMAHSYALAGATAGMHIVLGCPDGYRPAPEVVDRATRIATGTGGSVRVVTDPVEAVTGADAVATDTWTSMGHEEQVAERERALGGYAVTARLLEQAATDALVMHCLPAHRGVEISAEVLDGPRSVIWDEAENRRHVQKAVLVQLDRWAGGSR